jgi:aminoglycoside/choline kinase family phosphotransferase
MHARFDAAALADERFLVRYDVDCYRLWITRAADFVRNSRHAQARAAREKVDWLAARYDKAVRRLCGLPVTLIHNEFYPSNVIVQRGARTPRIRPVDWEMAAAGPALIDLAALTSGKWSPQQKGQMADAYWRAARDSGSTSLSRDAFHVSLDFCRLHVAVQWVGWSRRWSPPAEHQQDWLGEAVALAGKLGL